MIITGAVFADLTQLLPDGKINVIGGGWDSIYMPVEAPVSHTFQLVAFVQFDPDEDSRGTLTIRIINPQGEEVLRGEGLVHAPGKEVTAFAFPLSLTFDHSGRYVMMIETEGNPTVSLPLKLVVVEQPSA